MESWLKQLWLQCQQYNIHIQMDVLDWCIHDIELMQLFDRHGYHDDKIKTLNCC